MQTKKLETTARARLPEHKALHLNDDARLEQALKHARSDDDRKQLRLGHQLTKIRHTLARLNRLPDDTMIPVGGTVESGTLGTK